MAAGEDVGDAELWRLGASELGRHFARGAVTPAEYLDTLLNPTVLVEVLSKSTERYDRIAKTSYYRTLDSLKEHLLVSQDEIRVEHYVKQADGTWLLIEHRSLDSDVELQSIGCSLGLRDIYDKVRIDPHFRPAPR